MYLCSQQTFIHCIRSSVNILTVCVSLRLPRLSSLKVSFEDDSEACVHLTNNNRQTVSVKISSVTSKKMPNFNKNCPKLITLEKLKI